VCRAADVRQVTVTCGVCVLLQLPSGPPQVWRMQPEKVVRHDDTGCKRRLGNLLAGSEKRLSHQGCVCRGKELQSRISMPRPFVKFVASALDAFLRCCRTGAVH